MSRWSQVSESLALSRHVAQLHVEMVLDTTPYFGWARVDCLKSRRLHL
jgi:hypothetical protein